MSLKYKCSICGEVHEDYPALTFPEPDSYYWLNEDEKKLYNANIIKENEIKFTDTKLIGTEDALFNISYLQYGKSVYVIDAPLYYYRKYNINSLTANYKSNLSLQWGELYSRIYTIIENKDETFYQAYQNRICLGIIGIGLNELLSKNPEASEFIKPFLGSQEFINSIKRWCIWFVTSIRASYISI